MMIPRYSLLLRIIEDVFPGDIVGAILVIVLVYREILPHILGRKTELNILFIAQHRTVIKGNAHDIC